MFRYKEEKNKIKPLWKVRHGKGKIQIQCDCGHKMRSDANILNDFKLQTIWTCHKCGNKYLVMVSIRYEL